MTFVSEEINLRCLCLARALLTCCGLLSVVIVVACCLLRVALLVWPWAGGAVDGGLRASGGSDLFGSGSGFGGPCLGGGEPGR